MTNFDFLLKEPRFRRFAVAAVAAEKIIHIDPEACAINCRRAMEAAIKWMYSVDRELHMPYQETLVSLMSTDEFHDIVGRDLWKRLDFIRLAGNNAAHAGKTVKREHAELCLENLFVFMDFVAYCYGDEYTEGTFNYDLLKEEPENNLRSCCRFCG